MADISSNGTGKAGLSLPALVGFASGLVSLGVMWGTLQYQAAEHERRIAGMEADLDAANSDTQRILNSLTELKTDVRYLREKLSEERGAR